MKGHLHRSWVSLLTIGSMALAAIPPLGTASVLAAHTPTPASVNLVGSLQSEATANACGDWDPGCVGSRFTAQPNGVYSFASASIPTGSYEYKVAMGGWSENYGSNFQQDGPNIALNLSADRTVQFIYDHKTHFIADTVRNTIYTVPGNFNDEVGCSGDWQPECLATFMSDVDGDGIYTFVTDEIPAGTYEFKVATNQSWSNPNYGANGGGDNIPFTVAGAATVTFSFNTANNVPGVQVQSSTPGPDNNIAWDGLRHDSRDTLYRTPGGAVKAGTPVTIRFRTFHNDVTAVRLRLYDLNANGQRFVSMTPAVTDVDCAQAGLEDRTCDFWTATVTDAQPNNFWYRFIVQDGTRTVYYADNTAALDGGLGAPSDTPNDQSFALMMYAPSFSAPSWAKSAVIYQIFPDRFRNGSTANDPRTGDHRYDDPVLALPWNTLPEGYCRNYTDGNTGCPWRYDTTPPDYSPTKESPRGRDYMGGDLKGVTDKLDHLQKLGVTAIYFNPIFAAGSNHRYDTRDYYAIDPYLGTMNDYKKLVKEAQKRNIRVILDGVYNHMSSDSDKFDRYRYFSTVGACESGASLFRSWFNFRAPTGNEPSPCAPSTAGGNDTYYSGWFGFDSIPEINKNNPDVQKYFITDENSISRYWLRNGAAGWRLDVMGDASFPNGYWEDFRDVVKETDPNALIIGELWQKDSTLLRYLRGDRADTTMNYRLRDAVLGLLVPSSFDSKGFGDSGRVISPSEFGNRIASIREDYSDAAYYSLMNLLDSHDTERLLWTLTPGAETRADKEFNTTNLASGKQRQRLAALIQFTMPGAPTVYYGDEVGVTGDDDPDDRRTFPWPDTGGTMDNGLMAHYSKLSSLRKSIPSMTSGDIRVLLTDDAKDVVAYGRKSGSNASIVAINRGSSSQTVDIPLAGYIPNNITFISSYTVGADAPGQVKVQNGKITLTLKPLTGLLLYTGNQVDLTPTAAPKNLRVSNVGEATVSLAWDTTSSAKSYNVYRSIVKGGGYVKVNSAPITGTTYTDTSVENAREYFYVVKALDSTGNESAASNEVSAVPSLDIDWANLQWPYTIEHTISVTNPTPDVYGQVYIADETQKPGATPTLIAQLGFGPRNSNPATASGWKWKAATFNANAGNNDEFKANLLPDTIGEYDYAYRYSTSGGRTWVYADRDGTGNGYDPAQAGKLSVVASSDTSAPSKPTGLTVVSASPDGVVLNWNDNSGDATLYGYEVLRSSTSGGPYTRIATVTESAYTDTAVDQGATYYYVVRALDTSFNRSANSSQVEGTAELRTVTLKYTVTVPASTDGTGKSVHIAGFLDRLNGGLPQWNPGGVALTRVNATTWTITFTGTEGTQIEYKYALGSWDYVEKDGSCGEVANRQLTLAYGSNGTQNVTDTIDNWRNVSPCGN